MMSGVLRLVDQDRVHFVDDCEVVTALHEVREVELHVVAQVVEAVFVVGPVRDVRSVGDLPLLIVQLVLDDADRHPEEPVDLAHPLGVAAGEVVVHRDDVDALALERVQVGGQRRDERLALARLHFRDPALVQHDAANELDVEMPHVQGAASGLANDRERFRQDVVERGAVGHALAQLRRLLAQHQVAQGLDGRLERVDGFDDRADLLQLTFVLRAEDFREQAIDHEGGAGSATLGISNDCTSRSGEGQTGLK